MKTFRLPLEKRLGTAFIWNIPELSIPYEFEVIGKKEDSVPQNYKNIDQFLRKTWFSYANRSLKNWPGRCLSIMGFIILNVNN